MIEIVPEVAVATSIAPSRSTSPSRLSPGQRCASGLRRERSGSRSRSLRVTERAAKDFGVSWGSLPEFALRFCLSDPRVSTILTGAQTAEELSRSLAATAVGPLPEDLLARAAGLALSDDRLLDPSRWPSV